MFGCFYFLCLEYDTQISISDNQEAEITLRIHVRNTTGEDITLCRGETNPPSLVYTIQAISSFNIISPVSNEEEEGEEMNANIYVKQQNVNEDDIDSMEYEQSYQHRESDNNFMEEDNQEQWDHHMHEQGELVQSKKDQNQEIKRFKTSPVSSQVLKQQSSQIMEEQRREKEILLSMQKDELIPKYEEVKRTAIILEKENKDLRQQCNEAKKELEQYKAEEKQYETDYFSRKKEDQEKD